MATLKKMLGQMLTDARRHEGSPISRTLSNGVRLEITQAATGNVQLTLERQNTAPTDEDWRLVQQHWPELVPPGVVPASRKDGRRFTLTGRWARPALVTETAG